MSGRRHHSGGYDPDAGQPRLIEVPARPLNALQWLGIAFVVVGILLLLANFAGGLGIVRSEFGDSLAGAVVFVLAGTILATNRRDRIPADQPHERWRRVLPIMVLLAAAIVLAILIFVSKGA